MNHNQLTIILCCILFLRPPKPGRAAKAHAAAAVAADAMGALMGHQMASFPPDLPSGSAGPKKAKGKLGAKVVDKPEKAPKAKAAPQVTTLVTETVGCIVDDDVSIVDMRKNVMRMMATYYHLLFIHVHDSTKW
jgi:hypothetical protein